MDVPGAAECAIDLYIVVAVRDRRHPDAPVRQCSYAVLAWMAATTSVSTAWRRRHKTMFHEPIEPARQPMLQPDQRREGKRHTSVLLIGRVRRSGDESACLVHDISAKGLMARFTSVPATGDRLLITVRGLPEIAATVRWVNGYRGGVEFDAVQDIAGVFCLRDDQGHVARTPRFAMQASTSMRIGDLRGAVDILDISPGGVKLRSDAPVSVGQAGSVLLPEIDVATFGTICWTRDDRFGFRFCTPLPLAILSRVLGCG